MNREKLALYLHHHGLSRTFLAYTLRALQRLVDLDVMRVETTSDMATGSPDVEPYVSRQITADEYRKGLRLLGEGHDRSKAFDRKDRCFANLLDSQLVGYQFYAGRSTKVRTGLAFEFPDNMTYAYASFTHPDHRGQGLAKSRANARRRADQSKGIQRKVIWYISVDNLPSRAVSRRLQCELVGYVGFVRVKEQYFCFASPECKRFGVALVPTSNRTAG